MRTAFAALLTLFLSAAGARAEPPPSFQQLSKKLAAIDRLRFKYTEHYTPTGMAVGSPPIPMVKDFHATVSASRKGMYFTYRESETARSWESSGTFISNGVTEWHYQNPGGTNNPSFVSKRPVGFQEDLQKRMAAAAPQLKRPASNCLQFERLFDAMGGSTPWSPFALYTSLEGRSITFDGSDLPDSEGLHHWVVMAEKGCRRVELWIDDKDGTLTKYVSYNPYQGFESRVEFVGEFTDKERNPEFAADLFTFDAAKFPGAHVMEVDAGRVAEMAVNTFATPPALVFGALFEGDPATARELEGTGSQWFTYNFQLRFAADKLPKLKRPLPLTAGTPATAVAFFESAFPKDKDLLAQTDKLELQEGHKDKSHLWVLHHREAKVFFVRAWGDE